MLESGSHLGHYEVLSKLGEGGMGVVHRAWDGRLGREVAIKVLPPSLAGDPERLKRLRHEARTLAALHHPNLLMIHDLDEQDGSPFLVMELLKGETLAERLVRGPLPWKEAVDLGRQAAEGLAAAHRAGIVHRDLKPANLFLLQDGGVKLLDFGLAKFREPLGPEDPTVPGEGPSTLTREGLVVGTAAYMSPEQAAGKAVDGRSDLFSLGTTLWEALTGGLPFSGATRMDLLHAISREAPLPFPTGLEVPPGLQDILLRCLEKDPDRRFQHARDLAFALQTVTGSGSGPVKPRFHPKGSGLLTLGLGLVAVGGLAAWSLKPTTLRPLPRYEQLSFVDDIIGEARFMRGGRSVAYTQLAPSFDPDHASIQIQGLDTPFPRPAFAKPAILLSASSRGELAVLTDFEEYRGHTFSTFDPVGSLGRCPQEGSMPRVLSRNVTCADWTPDGSGLALVRADERGCQLEYPEGRILLRVEHASLANLRFSPDGKTLALIRHPIPTDDMGFVLVVDAAKGRTRDLGGPWAGTQWLAWGPDGKEVWFSCSEMGDHYQIRGIGMDGKTRPILNAPFGLWINDVSPDGRVLIRQIQGGFETMAFSPESLSAHNLGIRNLSVSKSLSPNGRWVVVEDETTGIAGRYPLYLRATDGSQPILLGPGQAASFSPDIRSVAISSLEGQRQRIRTMPIKGGPETPIQTIDLDPVAWHWSAKGDLMILSSSHQGPLRLWIVTPDRPPEPVGPLLPGTVTDFHAIDPAGQRVYLDLADGEHRWTDLGKADGTVLPVPGLDAEDHFIGASQDGVWGYFIRGDLSLPATIERVNLKTGSRSTFRKLEVPGVTGPVRSVFCSVEGDQFVINRGPFSSQLFLVEGIR